MQTVSTAFERELRKSIEDQIEQLKEQLELGYVVKDLADYQRKVEIIRAYKAVIESFDSINEKINSY